MAATQNGIALVWGLPDFVVTGTTILGQIIPQSFDHSKEDTVETIKDRSGKRCTQIFPDPIEGLTIEGFVRAASGTNTIANAKTQTLLPLLGTLVQVCFTAAEYAAVTSGQYWTVTSAKQSGTNTSAIKVSLNLEYASGITTGPVS